MNGDIELSFALVVKRFGQKHFSTVGELNLEVLGIRLTHTQNTYCNNINNGVKDTVMIVSMLHSCRHLTDAWSME